MRARAWGTSIGLVLALVVGAFAPQAPATAAAQRTWYDIPAGLASPIADWVVARAAGPLSVGDCEERDGVVVITQPDAQGWSDVIWYTGDLRTSHTNNYDQWHQSFVIKSGSGAVLASIGGLDGPRMYHVNEVYSDHMARGRVQLSQHLWQLIAKVDWTGEC